MVDKLHPDDEKPEDRDDLNFIDEPSQLDKYQAAALIADGKYSKFIHQIKKANKQNLNNFVVFVMSKFYRVFSCNEACNVLVQT